MLCFKLFTLFMVALCLVPEHSQVSATFWLKKCAIKRCSSYESPVYTSDGTNCFIFRNSCYVKNYTCRRSRENLPNLSLVTKEACQAQCQTDCNAENAKGTPVCGEYAGLYTTFESECELLRTACLNGQGIVKVRNTACPTQG